MIESGPGGSHVSSAGLPPARRRSAAAAAALALTVIAPAAPPPRRSCRSRVTGRSPSFTRINSSTALARRWIALLDRGDPHADRGRRLHVWTDRRLALNRQSALCRRATTWGEVPHRKPQFGRTSALDFGGYYGTFQDFRARRSLQRDRPAPSPSRLTSQSRRPATTTTTSVTARRDGG